MKFTRGEWVIAISNNVGFNKGDRAIVTNPEILKRGKNTFKEGEVMMVGGLLVYQRCWKKGKFKPLCGICALLGKYCKRHNG